MKKPVITVIVPIYNVEKFLPRCIDSILNQSYEKFELLLIDDGSSDKSGIICNEYRKKDSRIKVIHQENKGVSYSRNIGVKHASGDYISFVDSDDIIKRDYLEYLLYLIQKFHCKISVCDFQIFRYIDEIRDEKGNREALFSVKDVLESMLYDDIYFISPWGKLYERSLFKNITYPEGKIYEDIATTYKLYCKVDNVACGYQKKYLYYTRDESLTKKKFSIDQFHYIESTKQMTEDIVRLYPDLKEGAIVKNVHAYFSTYCRLINSDENYEQKKKEILTFIKQNRWIVLKNKKAIKKDKFAVIVLIFGENVFKKIWNFYRKKKYKIGGKNEEI